jgi:uncharacterized protein YkwD
MAPVRRSLALGAFSLALLALPAVPIAATAEDATSASAVKARSASTPESRLLAAVNRYRRAHGLRSLRRAASLNRTSRRQARRILRSNTVRHSRRPINRRYRRVGENLAWSAGRSKDANSVVNAWAASPSHRSVLLSGRMRWIGTAREYGDINGTAHTVWVLQVGGR